METLKNFASIEYNGPKLAVLTIVIDWFVLLFVKSIRKFYEKRYKNYFNKKEKAVKEKDIKNMAVLGRKAREAKIKLQKLQAPKFLKYLRILVPLILFRNCYICTTSVAFWKPFTRFVSFPNKVLPEDTELKIGFIFFWLSINKFDLKLADFLYSI